MYTRLSVLNNDILINRKDDNKVSSTISNGVTATIDCNTEKSRS